MSRQGVPGVLVVALILLALSATAASAQGTFYVATTGSNATGDGSIGNPWATIRKALDSVPDGSLVLVRPGTYTGVTRLVGNFVQGVTIRSEVPYRAQLRNNDRVINTNDCAPCRGITIEGFDIAHSGAPSMPLVIHIDGQGFAGTVSNIIFRNNVLHDSFNNDILKINNSATCITVITVTGNIFHNQWPSSISGDEHIDVNSVTSSSRTTSSSTTSWGAAGPPTTTPAASS